MTFLGGLQVWSVADRRRVTTLLPSDRRARTNAFAVSPRGEVAAATGSAVGQPSVLYFWDPTTWKGEAVSLGSPEQLRSLCYNPTGTHLATEAGLFVVHNRNRMFRTKFHAEALAWSPTAPLLAGRIGNTITLWRMW